MKPQKKSLLNSLCGNCKRKLNYAIEDIETVIKFYRKKNRDKTTQHLVRAVTQLQELEIAIDELYGAARDFERLFNQFYNDAIEYQKENQDE